METRLYTLSACLATPLQRKLRRKLYRVTLAVRLDSTFRNDYRYFFKPCKLQPGTGMCDMSLAAYNGLIYPTLRDKLQEKLHRVTLALKKETS